MDPQHNTTSGLGVAAADDSISVYDLITNGTEYKTRGRHLPHPLGKNWISCRPHIDLSGAEIELVDEEGTGKTS